MYPESRRIKRLRIKMMEKSRRKNLKRMGKATHGRI